MRIARETCLPEALPIENDTGFLYIVPHAFAAVKYGRYSSRGHNSTLVSLFLRVSAAVGE